MNESKPDPVATACKTLSEAVSIARIAKQSGEISVSVHLRDGTPNPNSVKIATDLTAPVVNRG